MHPERAGVVTDVHGHDLADRAVMDARNDLLFRRVVAVAQTGNHRQAPTFGLVDAGQHAAHAGGIDRHRLLGEDVFAGLDGRFQMGRTKVRRRSQNGHINVRGQYLLVGVEAGEAMVRADGHAVGRHLELLTQIGQAGFEPVGEDVAQGGELHVLVGIQRLHGRAGAAAAAADQTHTQFVRTGGMRRAGYRKVAGQARADQRRRGCLEKSAARRQAVGCGRRAVKTCQTP